MPKLVMVVSPVHFSVVTGLGRRLPDYTLRYRDTLGYDTMIQFFSHNTSPKINI